MQFVVIFYDRYFICRLIAFLLITVFERLVPCQHTFSLRRKRRSAILCRIEIKPLKMYRVIFEMTSRLNTLTRTLKFVSHKIHLTLKKKKKPILSNGFRCN